MSFFFFLFNILMSWTQECCPEHKPGIYNSLFFKEIVSACRFLFYKEHTAVI